MHLKTSLLSVLIEKWCNDEHGGKITEENVSALCQTVEKTAELLHYWEGVLMTTILQVNDRFPDIELPNHQNALT
jgi:hypothetical protein